MVSNAFLRGILEKRDSGPRTLGDPRTLYGPRTLEGLRTLWGPKTLWGFRILWWPRKDAGTYKLAKVSWLPNVLFNLVEFTIKGRFIWHCWMQIHLGYILFWTSFIETIQCVIQESLIYLLTAHNNYSTCFCMN